ncbi:heme exporter protein CcmD [Thiothrix fructosivorans]|uniref:Heme exporter protein D n=1 Tax=Thiothrix fructosivorans TaxID=111770 RepID=A0A8B0SK01_9GAMM|nr:heme exporter protein CcmD [Thiothrix fructosivorans]MBO0615320.1 heme exporter protein CcmD [Thiothrix fructosivorans]QTX10097.1 heme exporter protein CcmD [Thiothrix fructosivorans]
MAEFFHMGGYALYVWTSFGIAAVVLLLNIVLPLQQHREVLRRAADFHELEGRTKQ